MSAIIEFQGFTGPKGFIVKELAIVDVERTCCNTWLFKSPIGTLHAREASWLKHNYHGLCAYEGDIEYLQLETVLRHYTRKFKFLFTKGAEKAVFSADCFPRVFAWLIWKCTDALL